MSNPAANSTAEGTRTLVIERVFPHSPEKVWRALTESPLVAQWLMKNDFEPVVGKRFQFRSEPVPGWNGVIDCEVQIVEPQRRLAYSWSTMSAEYVVLWTLTPEATGTHVRMEQSGFTPDQQQAYGGAKYGWTRFMDNLEGVLQRAE
jgi:uncharacterized protein YndB with AHSA1/START domain